MRRILVAIVAALAVLSLTACSGSSSSSSSSTTTSTATSTPAPAPATGSTPVNADASAIESDFPQAFPAITTTATPAAIKQDLADAQPMLLLFYDHTQDVSKNERVQVDTALKQYRGLIDLVTFDIAKTSDGTAGTAAQTAAALASDLKISRTPYIVMVDGNGFITWRFKGYVDSGIIEREILRATK